jgi:hypothetical protein
MGSLASRAGGGRHQVRFLWRSVRMSSEPWMKPAKARFLRKVGLWNNPTFSIWKMESMFQCELVAIHLERSNVSSF